MHPNDIQITRVYAQKKGGAIFEDVLSGEIEAVIEGAAGSTLLDNGARYIMHITVRDLTELKVVQTEQLESRLTEEPWIDAELSYRTPIPKEAYTAGNLYDILVVLSTGVRNPNVSFAKSPPFVVARM